MAYTAPIYNEVKKKKKAEQQEAKKGDVKKFTDGDYESLGYVHKDEKSGELGEDPAEIDADERAGAGKVWIAPGKDPERKEYWRKKVPVS